VHCARSFTSSEVAVVAVSKWVRLWADLAAVEPLSGVWGLGRPDGAADQVDAGLDVFDVFSA
jgi:hypothetical protein